MASIRKAPFPGHPRRTLPLALEPRMMFDAAAVATAVDTASQAAQQQQADQAPEDASGAGQTSDLAAPAATSDTTDGQAPELDGSSTALDLTDRHDGYDPADFGNILDGANDIAISDDGAFVYATRTLDGQASALSVFSLGADGQLTLVQGLYNYQFVYNDQTFENDRVVRNEGLAGAASVTLSQDQNYVYVVGRDDKALVVFARDGATGQLTRVQSVTASADNGLDGAQNVRTHGDYVYVSNDLDHSIAIFQRAADGSLAFSQAIRDGVDGVDGLEGATSLTIDPSGQFLFVAGSAENAVTALRIGSDGSLTPINTIKDPGNLFFISALTLSPDGKTLYAVNADNDNASVVVLSVGDDGRLASSQVVAVANATQVAISKNGTAAYVLRGEVIDVFARADDGTLSFDHTDTGLSLSTGRTMLASPDGAQLYVTGNNGLSALGVGLPATSYREGGEAVALLPSARIADPQLDALGEGIGDYNGASLHVVREGEANPDERLGFAAGNGLALADGQILKDGQAIASFVQAGQALTVTFIASVSKADAQNVLRQITYVNFSQDPGSAVSPPVFAISLDDGDGNRASVDITVDLQAVNDPPVLESTPLAPTLRENGEAVRLFENTRIDTIESSQAIWQIILTIDASGPDEVLRVAGNNIVVQDTSGPARTAGGVEYQITVEDGKATVRIFQPLNPARTSEQVAALIDGIAYGNTGDGLSGTRSIGLSVMEHNYSGSAPVTALAQQAVVTLAPPESANTAPALSVPAPSQNYTEQAEATPIAPGAIVADAQMDALNGGAGNYAGATLTITLGAGAGSLDALGVAAGNGLALDGSTLSKDGVAIAQVSSADGVLTIRFHDDVGAIPTQADVQNTLRQVTYANSSDAPAARVAIDVTLADRLQASQTLALEIAIEAVNDAPVLGVDPLLSLGELQHLQDLAGIPGLSTPSASAFSSDASHVFIADGQGAIALFSRGAAGGELTHVQTFAAAEGVTGITRLQVSADGNSLYALGNNGNAIVWYSLDASGSLAHQATITDIYEVHGSTLYDMRDIAVSEDGRNLYLVNASTVAIFNRAPATGELTYVGKLDGNMWGPPYLWAPTEIASRGDLVFVTTDAGNGSSLIVYQRDADGALSLRGYTRDAGGENMAGLQHIAVSADGTRVFVANSSRIESFTLDTGSGALTHQGTFASGLDVRDIALSADGAALFATLASGTLNYYATADGSLKSTQAVAEAGRISLSADGGIVVLGTSAAVLEAPPSAPVTAQAGGPAVPLAPTLLIGDAELDSAASGAGDYRGASLAFSGQAGDVFGFRGDGYSVAGSSATVDGQVQASFSIGLDGTQVATLVQNGNNATLAFTASLTKEQANAILRQVTYASIATTGGSVPIGVVFSDGTLDSPPLTITVTVTVEGGPGVPENTPPTVDGETELALGQPKVGASYSYQFPAGLFTDADAGDTLAWRVTGLPPGLSFDAATRTLSGTPTAAGSFTLTLTATDTQGASASHEVTLDVAEADATEPTPVEVTLGGTTNSYAAGGDPIQLVGDSSIKDKSGSYAGAVLTLVREGGANAEDVFSYRVENAAENDWGWRYDSATKQFSQNGTVVATVDDSTPGQWIIAFGDGATWPQVGSVLHRVGYANTGSDSETVRLSVSYRDSANNAGSAITEVAVTAAEPPNTPPVADDSLELAPGQPKVGESYSYQLPATLFTDADAGDVLTWSVEGLPPGLSFDAATRTLSGTPTAAGSFTLTFTATDTQGASASREATLDVAAAEPPNTPPVADGSLELAPGQPKVGESYSYQLPAALFTDADAGDVLAWSVEGLPPGLSFDAATRTLSGTPTAAGEASLTFKATDRQGASASRTLTLAIAEADPANLAPVANDGLAPAPGQPRAGQSYAYTLPAELFADGDGDTLAWTVSGLPQGLVFDAATRTLSGTPAAAGSHVLTITVRDPSGASASRSFTLEVAEAASAGGGGEGGGEEPLPVIPSTREQPLGPLDRTETAPDPAIAAQPASDVPGASILPPAAFLAADAQATGDPAGSARLLDTLLSVSLQREQTENPDSLALQTASGEASPLVALASADGPALAATERAVSGHWRIDPAGNRQVFELPAGLVSSRSPIESITLRAAGGGALPAGVRLDAANGTVIAPGLGGARALALELVVRTIDGQAVAVPIAITPERPAAWLPADRSAAGESPLALAAKPALSEQLRQGPASDLLAQARTLLAQLADAQPAAAETAAAAAEPGVVR